MNSMDLKFRARVGQDFLHRKLAAPQDAIQKVVVVLVFDTFESAGTFCIKKFSLDWWHLVPVRIQQAALHPTQHTVSARIYIAVLPQYDVQSLAPQATLIGCC